MYTFIKNSPSLTLMCVCVKPSFSSLFPISILIQSFRCLEVVKNISSQYDYENTTKELEAVRVGMSIHQTSIEFEVPAKKLYLYIYMYLHFVYYFRQCTHWFLLSIFWKFHFPFGQSKLYSSLSSFFSQYIRENYIYMKWYYRVEAQILCYISNYN